MTSVVQDAAQTAPKHRHGLLQKPAAPNEQTANLFTEPSSSTNGFFQAAPRIVNQLADDVALQRALRLFLPSDVRKSITPELSMFADKVLSKEVLDWVADAEKNTPYLRTWDSCTRHLESQIMSSEYTGSRGIKRIRQACLPCRYV